MTKIDSDKVIENATPSQREELMRLQVSWLNLITDMAEKHRKYSEQRKKDNEALGKIEATITALLEKIASGQMDMYEEE